MISWEGKKTFLDIIISLNFSLNLEISVVLKNVLQNCQIQCVYLTSALQEVIWRLWLE